MHLSKTTKTLLMAALAATAISAVLASSAAATIVPAKFSSSAFKLTTSGITVKRNGAEPKACTLAASTEGLWDGASYMILNQSGGETKFYCSGNYLTLIIYGAAKYDNVADSYFLTAVYTGNTLFSPWGYYQQAYPDFKGTWTNGSAMTPSTLSYNEAQIGTISGTQKLTISGTLNVTTSSGGLITLSH